MEVNKQPIGAESLAIEEKLIDIENAEAASSEDSTERSFVYEEGISDSKIIESAVNGTVSMRNMAVRDIISLAFLGDSVYELFVREHVLLKKICTANRLHKAVVRYVNANAQAKAAKILIDELSETELSILKRGRNHKTKTKAKNVNLKTYKWATGFEALIGFLHVKGEDERLKIIMKRAVEIIEGKE